MSRRPPVVRHCPACGGPGERNGESTCAYCEGPLVPIGVPDPRESVVCGACATLAYRHASFCHICGAALAKDEGHPVDHACPGCAAPSVREFGIAPDPASPRGHRLHACTRCGGVFVPRSSFSELIRVALAEVAKPPEGDHAHRRSLGDASLDRRVVYRRCPECSHWMQRRNYGGTSGVVLDECALHGVFCDAGELEGVLAFVRSGGLVAKATIESTSIRSLLALQAEHRAASPVWELDVSTWMAWVRWIFGGRHRAR